MTRAEIIGYNFRRLRDRAKLKPKQAAEAGGVGINYIYQVQGAKVPFGRDAQEKWAEVFGCTIADFFRDPQEQNASFSDFPEIETLLQKVVRVMTSEETGTKLALAQNIDMFAEKVTEREDFQRENSELRSRLELLEKRLGEDTHQADDASRGSPPTKQRGSSAA